MGKPLLVVLFIFVLNDSFCQQQILGFSLPPDINRVEIPIEIHNNLAVVPVVLNNTLPLKFIVDTGVRTAILTEKIYSDILNLSYSRKYTISGAGGQKLVDAYLTNNVTFDMPGVHGQGHSMLVLDQDYLELKNSMGIEVHGILGYELFSRFVVTVNYETKRLILERPDKFKPRKSFQVLPITVEDTKPFIRVPLAMTDSAKLIAKLLVDSGASHGIFLEIDSDSAVQVPKKNIDAVLGRGLGGIIIGKIGRVRQLSLGSYQLPNLIANFPIDYIPKDSTQENNKKHRNGSIGGDLLSRFTVVFDFPHEKIYLKKNGSFNKKFYYNLSGLTIRAKGARLRDFEISDVRKDTNAEKCGLQAGDRLLIVNGIDLSELELNNVNSLFNRKPGKKIKLMIMRNGEKLKKEFVLESQI
ncbi:MAG: aspartyl protease family protein [Bacteroidetes bacterium]|nr:aspartyl protease family protein [Bacteroidota bacterium]